MYRIFNKSLVTIKVLAFSSLIVLFQGCASHEPSSNLNSPRTLLIETKAQIKDLKNGESHTAKIEIILRPREAIRLEVTAVLGISVASVTMTPKKIQYALHTSNQFSEGPFSALTLYPVFKQKIDPRILWNVIHNQNPETAGLQCSKDSNSRPQNCKGPSGLTVTWTYESDPSQRRIEIKNAQFEMVWVFKSSTPVNLTQNETFILKKPEGYEEIHLK